jgi:NAD(P)-dependent dehydrogenase (short-subunit alcohol dehydrogenase family)
LNFIDKTGESHKMNLMEQKYDLSGKIVVVTGATSGIGWRSALEFCRCGASVIGVGRNEDRCTHARAKILAQVPEAKIEYLVADLVSQREVRRLAEEIKKALQRQQAPGLDVLVNNAGTFVDRLTLTEDGIEKTVAVNHMAPFLLTQLLLPEMAARPGSRIITISSGSHYRTWLNPKRLRSPLLYNSLWAYKVSKLANVLFSAEFNRRHTGESPRAFAVDPGLVNTNIGFKGTGALARFVWRQRQKAGVDSSVPASTILFVAADPAAMQSEAVYWYLSAPQQPSRAASNPQLAAAVWQESARLCHLEK